MSGLTGPQTAVRGNKIAGVGMAIAVIATLLTRMHEFSGSGTVILIIVGLAIGTAIGIPAALRVKMTAMPEMVALFNGVGGGAVALIAWIEYRHHMHRLRSTRSLRVAGHDPVAVRGDRRLGLLLGLEHRLRQAPGDHLPASRSSFPGSNQTF